MSVVQMAMKLFYKVQPCQYPSLMEAARARFEMHQEVDEEKTILMLDDQEAIELVTGSYNPRHDQMAEVRVVLNDPSLRPVFDSIFGKPYLVKQP
jgi:hypothetical protein